MKDQNSTLLWLYWISYIISFLLSLQIPNPTIRIITIFVCGLLFNFGLYRDVYN